MPQAERERLADAFEEAVFTQGERCIAEGDDGDRFFLIRSGSASVKTRQRGEIASIGEGDFFGEMALISDAPRSATVTATSKQLTCLTIRRHTFTKLFGPLQELLEAHTAARTTEIGHTSLGDLKQYQIIGSGSFGHVTLCLHAKGGACYALKAMLKGRLAAQSQIERVLYEREALRKCSHPFIVTLAATLQDVETVYLLLEYVPGGELFSILQATRFLVDPVGAFYAACVTSALEHMHDRTIVYRDLKPENLLIDLEGYLKIVDFGFAKVTSTKTYTLCGTPEYLAPEIVLNQGHLYGADWWALGVLTHEMLVGAPPFADELEPMNIYKKILDAKLPEPKRNEPSLSKHARAFVQQLLTKEPSHRLGTLSKGAEDVRTHAFLGRINWRRLEKKLLQPPCTPQLSGPMDTSAYAVLSNPPYSSTDWGSSLTREVQRLFEEW
jgi:serine/threonine protein kinase